MKKFIFLAFVCVIGTILSATWTLKTLPESCRPRRERWLSTYPVATLGPFRNVLISFWWAQMSDMQRNLDFEKVHERAQDICLLNPYLPEVWIYSSWNMAFNLARDCDNDTDAGYLWVERGLDQLEQARYLNPQSKELYFESAFTLYIKCAYMPEKAIAKRLELKYGMNPIIKALEFLEKAEPFSQKTGSWAIMQASLYQYLGKKEKMNQVWEKIKKIYPVDYRAYNKLRYEKWDK